MSKITFVDGALLVETPYNAGLVAQIKSLPLTDRKWDANRKAWLVAAQHGATLAAWIKQYTGEVVNVPATQAVAKIETKILEVRYLGSCKPRDDGTTSAFGLIGKDWSAIFPEAVLKKWFHDNTPGAQNSAATLYQILGVDRVARDAEIKTAYRRMAMQWHPDLCKEPDAAERFHQVQAAYDALSDPKKRAKYDAGLQLQAGAPQPQKRNLDYNKAYRAPLLCGLIMASGKMVLGRFIVDEILAWEDITRGGRTLITSWPMGATEPTENWI